MINHGLFLVNGRKMDIPSYLVRKDEEISPAGKEKVKKMVKEALDLAADNNVPSWLICDEDNLKGKVLDKPKRGEIPVEIQEQLIVELCSK